jgi:hypothetical protein
MPTYTPRPRGAGGLATPRRGASCLRSRAGSEPGAGGCRGVRIPRDGTGQEEATSRVVVREEEGRHTRLFREAQQEAAAAGQREKEAARPARLLRPATPSPPSAPAVEEALWSPWLESPAAQAASSHLSRASMEPNVCHHHQERHRWRVVLGVGHAPAASRGPPNP